MNKGNSLKYTPDWLMCVPRRNNVDHFDGDIFGRNGDTVGDVRIRIR
jgi:hypothetical protein